MTALYNNDNGYDQEVAAAAEMNRQSLEEQQMRQEQEQAQVRRRSGSLRPLVQRPIAREQRMKQKARQFCPTRCWCSAISTSRKSATTPSSARPCGISLRSTPKRFRSSDLDLPATTKANEDRGLTFRVPAAGEGQ